MAITVEIEVRGGMAEAKARGGRVHFILRDYDTDGIDDDELEKDNSGRRCVTSEWDGGEQTNDPTFADFGRLVTLVRNAYCLIEAYQQCVPRIEHVSVVENWLKDAKDNLDRVEPGWDNTLAPYENATGFPTGEEWTSADMLAGSLQGWMLSDTGGTSDYGRCQLQRIDSQDNEHGALLVNDDAAWVRVLAGVSNFDPVAVKALALMDKYNPREAELARQRYNAG